MPVRLSVAVGRAPRAVAGFGASLRGAVANSTTPPMTAAPPIAKATFDTLASVLPELRSESPVGSQAVASPFGWQCGSALEAF